MKREAAAAIILVLLCIMAAWNICRVKSLTSDIINQLELSRQSAEQADWEASAGAAENGLKVWLKAEPYTHIFIRHPEIDSCSDAFYTLLSAIEKAEAEGLNALFDQLEYHLKSIAGMEIPSFGSVF